MAADSEAFDWNDEDALILAQQDKTAAYVNPAGAIVLRQDVEGYGDVFIIIQRENVRLVALRLMALLGQSGEQFGYPELPNATVHDGQGAASSGADRQRRYRERKRNAGDAAADNGGDGQPHLKAVG